MTLSELGVRLLLIKKFFEQQHAANFRVRSLKIYIKFPLPQGEGRVRGFNIALLPSLSITKKKTVCSDTPLKLLV